MEPSWPPPGEDVRSTGWPGRAGKGQDGGGESELHRRPVVAVGQRLDGGHVLDASAHDRRDGEPAGKAGAKRIRVLEGPWSTSESLEEVMLSMNWKPQDILNAAPNVEFENTNYLGRGKKYSRFMVPGGGIIYPGYDLNHSYEDCDSSSRSPR